MPELRRPPESLTAPCTGPAKLPEGKMSQREVERYWTKDRLNSRDCKRRHSALNQFYTERDNGLSAGEP